MPRKWIFCADIKLTSKQLRKRGFITSYGMFRSATLTGPSPLPQSYPSATTVLRDELDPGRFEGELRGGQERTGQKLTG